MTRKIMFIVECEVETMSTWTHNGLGDLLRSNIKDALNTINDHWAGGRIVRREVIYLPVLLHEPAKS